MKKLFTGLTLAASALVAKASIFFTLMNGNLYTNNNVAYNSGLNGAGAVTNNFQLGTCPGSSNILFALTPSSGQQPQLGTNGFLPSAEVNSDGGTPPNFIGGFPNTLYAPWNNTCIGVYGSLVATNATSTAVVFQFATSIDGTIWQTNYQTVTMTVPVNSFSPTGLVTSTFTTGGNCYVALQQINNPGTAALTNIVVELNGKPGL